MYSPSLLALITTILGLSSSSTAAPVLVASFSTTPSTSAWKIHHNTNEYLYPITTFHSVTSGNIIVFPNNNFEIGCNFVARGRAYNLCPLLYLNRRTKNDFIRHNSESSKGKGKEKAKEKEIEVFFVGTRGTKALGVNVCPKWAETCFVEREGPRMMVTSIPRDEYTGSSKTAVYATNFESGGQDFDLWLRSEERDVRVVFKCAEEDEIIYDGLKHDVAYKEMRVLRWHTPHACPVEVVGGSIETKAEDEKPAGNGEEDSVKDDELLVGGVSRGRIGFMVMLIVFTLITTTIVVSSPQARHHLLAHLQSAGYAIIPLLQNFKLVTRPLAKHIPGFRVTESRLVRWAREDMTLDEDEDFVVNGSSRGPQGWGGSEVVNEYIPLKSSPVSSKGGSHVISASWNYSTYGSVPFEALDVDETGVSMPRKPASGVKRLIASASERVSLEIKKLLRR